MSLPSVLSLKSMASLSLLLVHARTHEYKYNLWCPFVIDFRADYLALDNQWGRDSSLRKAVSLALCIPWLSVVICLGLGLVFSPDLC